VHRLSLVVFCSALLHVGQGSAQQVPLAWPPLSRATGSPLYADVPHVLSSTLPDTVARQIKPTYWKEGGLIGGAAAAAFSLFLVHELCTKTDATCSPAAYVLGTLGGGGVGFLLGALVGGQFEKNRKPASPDSTQVR
jgi:hypothetical protein